MSKTPVSHQPPAPRSANEHQPRLLLRFALYTGAVLLAAGLAIAWLVNQEVANRAERTVENQGRAIVSANLNSQLRPSDFTAAVSPARRATLDVLFRHSILSAGVLGGRLLSPNGTITYAANHRLIGTKTQLPSELRQVLDGSVKRHVTRTDTWRGEQNVKILRVIVPVRLTGSPHALGAVALDQDYRAVAVSINDARGRLALILTLALLALYVSLFPILNRVTRQLAAHNRRLREDAEERGLLLVAERAARAEAEAAQQLLAAQNERLRELDRLKDEFISLVSHELRTPLTSIRGYLELLREEGKLDEQQLRFIGIVDRNSERLLDLVSDLLFLAQVDAGKLNFELKTVDLEALVADCVEASLPTAAAKEIELTSSTQQLPVQLQGDPARLAQVLDNLVSNALKFTPSGGRVEVSLQAVDGVAVVEVTDTGVGLAEEEQGQLFERFFRSSRASENAIPGTGLGLAIAKTIVERHGGRIQLESAVDKGTTVRVELPLSLSESERSPHELAA
jgi:signal transduction histidine kinase